MCIVTITLDFQKTNINRIHTFTFIRSNMAPKLYTTDLSPPARSVLLTGAHLDIEFEEIQVDLFKKEHRGRDFLKVCQLPPFK